MLYIQTDVTFQFLIIKNFTGENILMVYYFSYQKFNALKSRNRGLKTLIAVGGWNAASKGFSDMSLTAANRAKFIRATIVFLKTHGFDGIDLDWEYPTQREGARPQDKTNFVLLLKVSVCFVILYTGYETI